MKQILRIIRVVIISVSIICFSVISLYAQSTGIDKYEKPPKEIEDILLTDLGEVTFDNMSPAGELFLLTKNAHSLVSLKKMAIRRLNLGEFEFHPDQNRLTRMTFSGAVSAKIHDINTGREVIVKLPEKDTDPGYEVLCSNFTWAPNGKNIAFFSNFSKGTELWVADVKTGKSKKLTSLKINKILATHVRNIIWTADSKEIVTVVVPFKRKPEPEKLKVAPFPRIIRTGEEKAASRTYRFLMMDKNDFNLFEYYSTGQIIKVNIKSKNIKPVGKPQILRSVDPGPDGNFLLVKKITKPFSYKVPQRSFGFVQELIDENGVKIRDAEIKEFTEPGTKKDKEKEKTELPKNFTWRADKCILYELDDPKPDKEDETKAENENDRKKRKRHLFLLEPPYTGEAKEIYSEIISQSPKRPAKVGAAAWYRRDGGPKYKFSEDYNKLIVTVIKKDNVSILLHDLAKPDSVKPETLLKYSLKKGEIYPGPVMTRKLYNRFDVIRFSSDNSSIYFKKDISWNYKNDTPANYQINRLNINDKKITNIFEENDSMREVVRAIMDDDFQKYVITRESGKSISQSFLINKNGEEKQLTKNTDPIPKITQAKNIKFKYMRVDGKRADGVVVLPEGFEPGRDKPLPAIFWIYPREFSSQKDYELRRRYSTDKNFPGIRPRTIDFLITQGYAVVKPDWPIIGPKGRINNNYVHDMQINGEACVDKLVKMGIIDRDRLAVGGHSYGAFATANMLAHTRLFKAGIAGDGAYNRSLTPMSFQRESRYIWDARSIYIEMSPFFAANRIHGALLMYHGARDPNVGTWPVQSERMIAALSGLGKTAVLYMYPYELHGPRGKETLLDMWARWITWLDKYVKNAVLPEEKYKKDYEKKE